VTRGLAPALALYALVGALSPATQGRAADAAAPINAIFVNRDRERLTDPAITATPSVAGALVKYTWRELEPAPDRYDFAAVAADLQALDSRGKRLFIQVQDVSFGGAVLVPEYLLEDPRYHGGAARKYESDDDTDRTVQFDGWVARRWDPAVRDRFAALLRAIGRRFDGRLAGVVLPETSIGFGSTGRLYPPGFTPEVYAESVRATMTAARTAFAVSPVMQFANFMPGEWRPWDDRGYLTSVYAHAARLGVGVGGPDLLPFRKGQQNHSLPLIAARPEGTIAALAVQDGNLAAIDPATGAAVTPATLYGYATDPLRLDYLFWGLEEPYFSRDVVPFLRTLDPTSPRLERR
jgi:hypothetical protein